MSNYEFWKNGVATSLKNDYKYKQCPIWTDFRNLIAAGLIQTQLLGKDCMHDELLFTPLYGIKLNSLSEICDLESKVRTKSILK